MVGGNGEVRVVVEPEFEIRYSGIAAFGIGVINARFPPAIPNTAKLQLSTLTAKLPFHLWNSLQSGFHRRSFTDEQMLQGRFSKLCEDYVRVLLAVIYKFQSVAEPLLHPIKQG